MKGLFTTFFFLFFIIIGFSQNKKFLTIQGKITNKKGDALMVVDNKNKIIKKILLNDQGVFKDTLHLVTERYALSDGNQFTIMYLKNGFDLHLSMDTKMFDESIVYTGKGAVENNFLAKNTLFEKQTDIKALLTFSEPEFLKGLDAKKIADLKRLEDKKLDSVFVNLQKKSIDNNYKAILTYYKKNYEANLAKSKLNNTLSPSFDFDNYAGGKTKLEDFNGKYVYIDVWATWCGPCRTEIPFLKMIEEKFHDKNISFISISIDQLKDFEKWKTMVAEKQLGGVQLFADKDWNSKFVKDFAITGIPRFILIDPKGFIINSDAPRPSSVELTTLLNSLQN